MIIDDKALEIQRDGEPEDVVDIVRRLARKMFKAGDLPLDVLLDEAARGNSIAKYLLEEGGPR